MANYAVYSIIEFKKETSPREHVVDQLTSTILENIKKDYPDAEYACILIRDGGKTTKEDAEEVVDKHPTVKGKITQTVYQRGSDKGQPPSSTNPL